jgi:cobalt-precorrin-5B (C1)-methyltransferase
LGGDAATIAAIRAANTAMEALKIAQGAGLPLGGWVARKARAIAKVEVDGQVDIELMVIDRAGAVVGHAGFDAG